MSKASYVYVISYPHHKFFKIGRSNSPFSRFETFQTASPFPYVVESLVLCSDEKESKIIERSLHLKFREKRFRNEWFSLDHEDVEWILTSFDQRIVSGA